VAAAVLAFFCSSIGLFLCLTAAAYARTKGSGGTLRSSVSTAADFFLWAVFAWQTLVQIARRASFLPSSVSQFYHGLGVLELDSSAIVDAACYADYPFANEAFALGGCLVAVALAVAFFAFPVGRLGALPILRRASTVLLSLLYPLACNKALAMVNCGSDFSLRSNVEFTCYAGDHLPVGALAWAVILTHVVGFPVATFVALSKRLGQHEVMPPAWQSSWAFFMDRDCKPHMFWLTHLGLLLQLGLAALLVFVPAGSSIYSEGVACLVTVLLLLAFAAVVYLKSPFLADSRWKLPGVFAAVGVSVYLALANFVILLSRPRGVNAASQSVSSVAVAAMVGLIGFLFVVYWRSLPNSVGLGGALVSTRRRARRKQLSSVTDFGKAAEEVVGPVVANPLRESRKGTGRSSIRFKEWDGVTTADTNVMLNVPQPVSMENPLRRPTSVLAGEKAMQPEVYVGFTSPSASPVEHVNPMRAMPKRAAPSPPHTELWESLPPTTEVAVEHSNPMRGRPRPRPPAVSSPTQELWESLPTVPDRPFGFDNPLRAPPPGEEKEEPELSSETEAAEISGVTAAPSPTDPAAASRPETGIESESESEPEPAVAPTSRIRPLSAKPESRPGDPRAAWRFDRVAYMPTEFANLSRGGGPGGMRPPAATGFSSRSAAEWAACLQQHYDDEPPDGVQILEMTEIRRTPTSPGVEHTEEAKESDSGSEV